MKYYLIVGEASGDLHASHLMTALKKNPQAEFRFFGGDLMAAVGGTMVKHYKELAYMGFIPVCYICAPLRNMRDVRRILWRGRRMLLFSWIIRGSISILLSLCMSIPAYQCIITLHPKFGHGRSIAVKNIKRDVDELFSILPFEVGFLKVHRYPIHYVGNPTVDEVTAFLHEHPADKTTFWPPTGWMNGRSLRCWPE